MVSRLIRIFRVQCWWSLFLFWLEISVWGKTGPKSQNCQFKLKFRKYLLFRLKFYSAKGASLHQAFMGNCPTISHMFSPYVTSRSVLLFVSGVTEQNESKVSAVNQGNEGGRWVEDFLGLPQGFGNFPSIFSPPRWRI